MRNRANVKCHGPRETCFRDRCSREEKPNGSLCTSSEQYSSRGHRRRAKRIYDIVSRHRDSCLPSAIPSLFSLPKCSPICDRGGIDRRSKSVMAKNVYTADEVARHDNIDDLWVVLNGKVYDLSKFVREHPGGEQVLLDVAGNDGTDCFDNIGHSEEAKMRREIYMIGELAKGTTAKSFRLKKNKEAVEEKGQKIDEIWSREQEKRLHYILPLTMTCVAIVIYIFLIKPYREDV